MRIILQPVTMRKPQACDMPVLEPSKLEPSKLVSETEFEHTYKPSKRVINVSGKLRNGYAGTNGCDCWWVRGDE